jgi:hypothetical protein
MKRVRSRHRISRDWRICVDVDGSRSRTPLCDLLGSSQVFVCVCVCVLSAVGESGRVGEWENI